MYEVTFPLQDVANVVCDVAGDLESHIFPRNDADIPDLIAFEDVGFDFRGGPFGEVWLLSAF